MDLSQLSDEELANVANQVLRSQQAQNAVQASHSGPAAAQVDPSRAYSPAWTGGSLFGFKTSPKVDQFISGMGSSAMNSLENVAGIGMPSYLAGAVNQKQREQAKLDQPLLDTSAGSAGRFTGDLLNSTAAAEGLGGAVGKTSKIGEWLMDNPMTEQAIKGGVQGATTANTPEERGMQAGLGAATGAHMGLAQSIGGKLVNGVSRTPAAQWLLDHDIPLTAGQMRPGGIMSSLEETSEHIPGIGEAVHDARHEAQSEWQRRVIQAGSADPANTVIPKDADLSEQLEAAYKSYEPLYNQAKGFAAVPGVKGPGGYTKLDYLFKQATQTPGTSGISDDARKQASQFLDSQLSRLDNRGQPLKTDDLLDVRSAIRRAARNSRLQQGDVPQGKAEIFDEAEKAITASLNSQLPPDSLTALRQADSQYGKYKTIENAVAASRDNIAGMTPQKLSTAIAKGADTGAYARGAGGELRDWASKGQQVFSPVTPMTGARAIPLAAGSLAAMTAPHLAAPMAGAGIGAMTAMLPPTGRAFAAGKTVPQQLAQALMDKGGKLLPGPAGEAARSLVFRGAQKEAEPYLPGVFGNEVSTAMLLPRLLMKAEH